jgi:Uma2 family endonuclease
VQVYGGEVGYVIRRDPQTVLVPDLAIVTEAQAGELRSAGDDFAPFAPRMAIEVKSPSDRESKIALKLALYLEAGVQEVWWVRPETRQVSVHRPDAAPRVLEVDQALESAKLPGFRLDLSALFADLT